MRIFYAKKKATTFIKADKFCLAFLFVICILFSFVGCKKEISYFDYVSELRSNILLAQRDGYSLYVYAVKKESPYSADGIPRERYSRTEIYLSAPTGDKTVRCTFNVGKENVCQEMSYDNVKGEYYLYSPVDVSSLDVLEINVETGTESICFQALSVLEKDTLHAETILKMLVECEKDLFASMTDSYGFSGEIYLRLIYEGAPYYYVGIIDRACVVHAFLMDAKTGKILAKRQS